METVWYEISGRRGVRYDSLEDARAAGLGGQIRRRVSFDDVPAVYAVRDADGNEIDRCPNAADAAVVSRQHPGAKVFMVADVPADAPEVTDPA